MSEEHIQIVVIFVIVKPKEFSIYIGIAQYFLIHTRIRQWRNAELNFAQNNYLRNILLICTVAELNLVCTRQKRSKLCVSWKTFALL